MRAYDSANFKDALLAGDVWLAQGWNGEFARVIELDPDLDYVVPREGGTGFIDSLAIPRGAPHPELAHAFLDFAMEAEIAAGSATPCATPPPNRAALALLPPSVRTNPAIFPPEGTRERAELLRDIGRPPSSTTGCGPR